MLQLRQYKLSINEFTRIVTKVFQRTIDIKDNSVIQDSARLQQDIKDLLESERNSYNIIDNVTNELGWRYDCILCCINWIDKENNIYEYDLLGFELVSTE